MPRAKVKWVEGFQFVATTESGHSIVLDSSEDAGGFNSGPRPMETLLVSLAGCTAFDIVHILRKMREDFTSIEVSVEGKRAETHPRVYREIEILYEVKGKNLKESNVKRAIELSLEKFCSVSAMLKKTAKINYSYKVIKEESN
jgi:putative redox protein